MELKQIRYFLQVAQSGNMTQAARSLFVTQQTLSKAILRLEDELDVPLFDRTVQGLRLTSYGQSLLPYAQKLMRDHDAALQAVAEMKQAQKTAIQFGFVIGGFHAGSAIAPSVLAEWEARHSDISIFVQESSPEELSRMVLDEDVDLAYTVQPNGTVPAGLNACVLRSEPLGVLISQSTLPGLTELSFKQLEPLPILIGRIGSDPRQDILSFFEHAGYLPNIAYYNGPYSQCFERVRMGEGVMISGLSHLHSAALSGMRILPFPDSGKHMLHLLIWKKSKTHRRAVSDLIAYLKGGRIDAR